MPLMVEIEFKGTIGENWSEWFGGLTISHSGLDSTVLQGTVLDQAELYGIIARLRDLGLQITSLSCHEM